MRGSCSPATPEHDPLARTSNLDNLRRHSNEECRALRGRPELAQRLKDESFNRNPLLQ